MTKAIERRKYAFPWNTEPSGLGSALCDWCGRDIPAQALPCSIAPAEGLELLQTQPGRGDRCKWELRTRGLAAGLD